MQISNDSHKMREMTLLPYYQLTHQITAKLSYSSLYIIVINIVMVRLTVILFVNANHTNGIFETTYLYSFCLHRR